MLATDGPMHPRPQLTRERWSDLRGTWGFAYDDDDVGFTERWQLRPEVFDREIVVPFPPESALSGIGDTGVPSGGLVSTDLPCAAGRTC